MPTVLVRALLVAGLTSIVGIVKVLLLHQLLVPCQLLRATVRARTILWAAEIPSLLRLWSGGLLKNFWKCEGIWNNMAIAIDVIELRLLLWSTCRLTIALSLLLSFTLLPRASILISLLLFWLSALVFCLAWKCILDFSSVPFLALTCFLWTSFGLFVWRWLHLDLQWRSCNTVK